MANRIVLVSLVLIVWFLLHTCNMISSGTRIFILLAFFLSLAATHTVWLLLAQKKHKLHTATVAETESLELNNWQPFIDIFISVKNESLVIEKTVRNFLNLNYPSYSLWIIDDCSTDTTPLILQELAVSNPKLKIIKRTIGSYPGKSAALNEALSFSTGEVIAIFDADAFIEADFFTHVLPALEPESVGAVQVQKKIYDNQKGFLVNCQAGEYALDTYFQMGRDLIGGVVEFRGNGEIIKRAALIDVGGWNDRAITDDLDLSMRFLISNWNITFLTEPYVLEEAVTNLKGLIRQRIRWAEGSIRRYLDYIFPLNSPRRLSLIERIDMLAFALFYVVIGLLGVEFVLDISKMLSGSHAHGRLILLMFLIVFLITQFNLFVASRIYQPELSFLNCLWRSFFVNVYIFLHWLPCFTRAISKILFGKRCSDWKPTKHLGAGFMQ